MSQKYHTNQRPRGKYRKAIDRATLNLMSEPLEGTEDMRIIKPKIMSIPNRTRLHKLRRQEGITSLLSGFVWLAVGVGMLVVTPLAYHWFREGTLEAPYHDSLSDTSYWNVD